MRSLDSWKTQVFVLLLKIKGGFPHWIRGGFTSTWWNISNILGKTEKLAPSLQLQHLFWEWIQQRKYDDCEQHEGDSILLFVKRIFLYHSHYSNIWTLPGSKWNNGADICILFFTFRLQRIRLACTNGYLCSHSHTEDGYILHYCDTQSDLFEMAFICLFAFYTVVRGTALGSVEQTRGVTVEFGKQVGPGRLLECNFTRTSILSEQHLLKQTSE